MAERKTYIVKWSAIVYGIQKVRARNKEEASSKAMDSEDIDMSEGLDRADWSIDSIDEEKQEENKKQKNAND